MTASAVLVTRRACPVCHHTGSDRLLDLPFDGPPLDRYLRDFYEGRLDPSRLSTHRYQLERCTDCGLVFQRDVPGTEFASELYGEIVADDAAAVEDRRGLEVRRAYSYDVEQLVKYWRRPPTELDVLDYGSGYGTWLRMAAAYGCRTAALELSERKAADSAAAGHRVVDPAAIPIDAFHFVNAEQVFEHLVDPAGAISDLAAALHPGGILRVSVPSTEHLDDALAAGDWTAPKTSPRSLNAVAPLEHVNAYDHGSLVRLGRSVGLEPFRYPMRQFIDPMERVRFVASAFLHRLRPARGALVLFRRPAS